MKNQNVDAMKLNIRCSKCNKKLAITTGKLGKLKIEMKCPRCKKIEIIKEPINELNGVAEDE